MNRKINSAIVAGAFALCHMAFLAMDARPGQATTLTIAEEAASDAVPLPAPQEVIQQENDAAWRRTLEQITSGLPTDIRQPRAFSDLAGKNRAKCDPQEMVAFGERSVPCWLVETIVQAADETGADAVYLMALADKESSFRLEARASTSTAVGLFQFLNATWLELVRDYGARHNLEAEAAAIKTVGGKPTIEDDELYERVMNLRENPYVAAVMAGEMLKRDALRIRQRLGRDLDRSEYYFAHFLGASSASRLIQANAVKPGGAAAGLLPSAARANRSLFAGKARKGRRGRSVTIAEFHRRIENMMEQRMEKYEEMKNIVLARADDVSR